MTKAELESKHLADLHALAAEAGVPRYRMLPRAELIEKLADGKSDGSGASREGEKPAPRGDRPPRRRERGGRERDRDRGEGDRAGRGDRERRSGERKERPPRERKDRRPREREQERPAREREEKPAAEPAVEAPAAPEPAPQPQAEPAKPKRKRRRRRFGRRSKELRVNDLLTPPPGRQALVYGESRAACTALLREIAAELSAGSDGPDPIALLVDPSPEELADWKREAPGAELVAAAQARHAGDALAQAVRRVEAGEDITLLVDSLTRLEDTELAKEIFDAGLSLKAQGSLTVVAALERSS